MTNTSEVQGNIAAAINAGLAARADAGQNLLAAINNLSRAYQQFNEAAAGLDALVHEHLNQRQRDKLLNRNIAVVDIIRIELAKQGLQVLVGHVPMRKEYPDFEMLFDDNQRQVFQLTKSIFQEV